jgi:tRNA-guanine transglycosylase
VKNRFSFKVFCRAKKGRARTGVIETAHGKILTPAFVPVGTQASVKGLSPEDLCLTGTQVVFVNSYHLHLRPGKNLVEKIGGLHRFMGWSGPLMTDSGGFQVFSLGRGGSLVKISGTGVTFRSHIDGSLHELGALKAIQIQKKLGADMIMAFDDCTPYPVKKKAVEKSLRRTHRWARESLEAHQRLPSNQALYGIVQGSVFKSLREESAKEIASLPFEGMAIGGVSVGETKEEMRKVCSWVVPHLPEEKPRHLLGVGEGDDVFDLVEGGIDTFDCVMPTRLGRVGWILSKSQISNPKSQTWRYDITKKKFKEDMGPLDLDCSCFVCQNFTRAYLHHLFLSRELLAYRLASFHNLFWLNGLFAKIREAIKDSSLAALRKSFY